MTTTSASGCCHFPRNGSFLRHAFSGRCAHVASPVVLHLVMPRPGRRGDAVGAGDAQARTRRAGRRRGHRSGGGTLGRDRSRSGSGVLIGTDGLVRTIGYLIVEADSIQITTQDQKIWPARPVAYDQTTGCGPIRSLAPLRGLTPVRLGSVSQLPVGEPLMVSTGGGGADIELTHLVSKRPFSGYWQYHIDDALFTSPPVVNHSGAPLFNQRGELVGIGSLFVGDVLGQEPCTPGKMFVLVDLLKPVLEETQATGSTRQSHRPWLGITSAEQGWPRARGAGR
jgi:serine protease Do